jgi:hypothetical protein
MAVRSVQPLIQTAPCHRRIAGWSWIAALSRRGWRGSGAALGGRRNRAACSSRRRYGALSLPVRDVFLVGWGTRTGRSAGGFAAGPVRPMVGNVAGKLGASPQTEAEAERCQRQKVSLEYHATRWVGPSARGMG